MNIELAQFVLDVQSWDLCPQEFKQKFKEFYMVGLLKSSPRTQFKRGIQVDPEVNRCVFNQHRHYQVKKS
jgi:hypothetical protein